MYLRLLEKLEEQRARARRTRSSTCSARRCRAGRLRDLLIEAIRYGDRPDVRAGSTRSSTSGSATAWPSSSSEHALAATCSTPADVERIRREHARSRGPTPPAALRPRLVRRRRSTLLGGRMRRARARPLRDHARAGGRPRARIARSAAARPVLPRYERVTLRQGTARGRRHAARRAARARPSAARRGARPHARASTRRPPPGRGARRRHRCRRRAPGAGLSRARDHRRTAAAGTSGSRRLRRFEFVEVSPTGRRAPPGRARTSTYARRPTRSARPSMPLRRRPHGSARDVERIGTRRTRSSVAVPEHLAEVRDARRRPRGEGRPRCTSG